ncbi:hypothetical protein [Novosphingobium mangrovi (ex Huang et al. 2023)]|uniref:Lipoprotein n=1 Tax=Novosphingobium mangrovi (ex Huang et al. 2023) TaxID=2976432 RepID=A0ABT2I974_9SPHN|nr:hypothetical protein [Novosphingobium mangrovi (ex Huang et al. 2023)]MCT2401331.1 hypothetical protein [Novosphingobium mangrovi (ex Huang et al. 2023)]
MNEPDPGNILHRIRAPLAACSLALLLAACGAGSVTSTPRPARGVPEVRQPTRSIARDPQFQSIPGVEGVIGATQKQLVRQFGNPRLDVWEGDARKLQFTGTPCVLDVYLYPTSRSHEPLATYVDARRASDGQDVDRTACVLALRRK